MRTLHMKMSNPARTVSYVLGHRERIVYEGWVDGLKIKKGWRTVGYFPFVSEWYVSESPSAEVAPIKPRIVA